MKRVLLTIDKKGFVNKMGMNYLGSATYSDEAHSFVQQAHDMSDVLDVIPVYLVNLTVVPIY